MATNASPQSGDVYLQFNGRDAYVEIPSLADYSASTTGELTISAWLRPDTLNFPSVERNSDYIHWLGKGERSGTEGNQEWTFRMYIVGVADSSRTCLYKDGQYIRCDTYRGPSRGPCEIHYQAPPNQNLQLVIDPQPSPAPLRLETKDLGSFFEGGLSRVRLWNRVLNATEIAALYSADQAPQDGLVAEFLLNSNTGVTAVDVVRENNGEIFNATGVTQD
jgi:hypothetical protein